MRCGAMGLQMQGHLLGFPGKVHASERRMTEPGGEKMVSLRC